MSPGELSTWLEGNALAALRHESSVEFQDVDGDGDGVVTREELGEQGYLAGEGGQGREGGAEEDALFAAADADGSGALSEVEFFGFLYPQVRCPIPPPPLISHPFSLFPLNVHHLLSPCFPSIHRKFHTL